jgi:maltose alpha-D-glucosyltransferase / alpha-amylase
MQKKDTSNVLQGDPLWYKDAILYEVHVRAFSDSNSDGMGDFRGLGEKLDYLEDLGVTALWLLPFFPSPWKDDGYDISDFRTVHPSYGTLKDFQWFLKEAHRRGIRVITELVINHTSDQHDWFQRSRRAAPGSRWRDFYVWSDTPEKYTGTRIIFKDFEPSNWTWDPIAKAYFWHRFYSHQPDLNFDNPLVRRAMFRTLDYWSEMGVDGFRLDAIPYLYEREGTNCENLPETHQFLKDLRRHMDERYPNRMLLAEANMWPEDAIAYFQDGNECQMAFHFPLMPRLFMALRLEDRFPIIEILRRTPAIPENCQWALFLRNHDELTLEMVTDEERDYMYRVYAADQRARINLGIRRRLAPLLGNDRPRIELMNAMLFSLPGTPVLYYGDEIGMGDNIYLGDRNGVRTPMQWSPDRNAGFSAANPQQLYLPVNIDPTYHYETVNVESQQASPHSLLSWMKRLILLRKQYRAFGRGTLEFLQPSNSRILAFVRRFEDELILVVANLSRFAQPVALSLGELADYTPVEMFGRTEFPVITGAPYTLTLGPSSFYWFSLEKRQVRDQIVVTSRETTPRELVLVTVGDWDALFQEPSRSVLARAFARFASAQSWYRDPDRTVRSAGISDVVPVQVGRYYVALLRLEFTEGDPGMYSMPVAICSEHNANSIAKLSVGNTETFLCDGSGDPLFANQLLEVVTRRKKLSAENGSLVGYHNRWFRQAVSQAKGPLDSQVEPSAERNTTIRFGQQFILKLLRATEPGLNPAVELGKLLSEQYHAKHVAPFGGTIEYQQDGTSATIGILYGFVPNDGDAWGQALHSLNSFYDKGRHVDNETRLNLERSVPANVFNLKRALSAPPQAAEELVGAYLGQAALLGKRLAELHAVLGRDNPDPRIAPEAYNDFYRQSLYHGMLRLLSRQFEFLRRHYSELPEDVREFASQILEKEDTIGARFRTLYELKIEAIRIRYHGQMVLEHVLATGGDFTFIDFEGDPALHLTERSIKRTPLRDVASLLHSFGHIYQTALMRQATGARHGSLPREQLRTWGAVWFVQSISAMLRGYLEAIAPAGLMPPTLEQQQALLDVHLLERALLDIKPLFLSRPDLLRVPFRVMLHLLEQ